MRSAATRSSTRCAQTRYGGVVAACGLAQGIDLPAHRDAVHPARRDAGRASTASWRRSRGARRRGSRLARDLDAGALDLITEEVPLDDAIAKAGALLAGGVRGRVVVRI